MICFRKACHGLLHFQSICLHLANRVVAQLVCTSAIAFIELVEMVDGDAPQKSEIPDRKTREDTSTLVRRVWKFQLKHHFWSVNSLGNHTVNKLHHFWMVFISFDREDFIFRAFAKIFCLRLALRIFHVHTFFTGEQVFLEKSWIFCRKWHRKHGYSSVMCLD